MKKNLIFCIMLVFILLLIGCLYIKDKELKELERDLKTTEISNNNKDNNNQGTQNNNEVTEEDNRLFVIDEENKIVINEIIPATDKVSLYEAEISIKDGNLLINDNERTIGNETITKVTAFYDQPGDLICIYALTKKKNIYVLGYVNYIGIEDKQFKKIDVNNVDNLFLLDIEMYNNEIGSQLPIRNSVYSKVENTYTNITKECTKYTYE